MNWYIGQEVVCVEASGEDELKEGAVYAINSLKKSPCKCGGCDIDVGIRGLTAGGTICECGYIEYHMTNVSWYHESQFKPLDELANIDELKEVLTEPIFAV